jgi:hypothetical protein
MDVLRSDNAYIRIEARLLKLGYAQDDVNDWRVRNHKDVKAPKPLTDRGTVGAQSGS